MKSTLLAVLLAAASLTACQTLAPSKPDRFALADKDKNGTLSRAEVASYLASIQFDAADKNKDGKLTMAEWNPAGTAAGAKVFKAADKNKDGIVTWAEAQSFALHTKTVNDFMKAADTNKDGVISRAEAKAYYASRE